jgi:hypothetical protein
MRDIVGERELRRIYEAGQAPLPVLSIMYRRRTISTPHSAIIVVLLHP